MADYYVKSTGSNTSPYDTWAKAATTFQTAAALAANGDSIYVSSTHTQSTTGFDVLGGGLYNAYYRVLSVNDSAAPPTAVAAGAALTVTSGNMLLRSRSAYYYGLTLTSTGTLGLGSGQNEGRCELEQCEINISASSNMTPALGSVRNPLYLKNCTINFAATSSTINAGGLSIEGGGIKAGSATPTGSLFAAATDLVITIKGFDFSNLSSSFNFFSNNGASEFKLINCKLPASWSGSLNTGLTRQNARYEMMNCDSADTNYRLRVQLYGGTITSETTVVRTSGASDGTTALSWKFVANSDAAYFSGEMRSPEIVQWNDTTGSSKTATIEIITDNVTLNDGEIWVELQYLGTSGFPISTYISDSKATILTTAANQASSSVAWTTTGLTTPLKQKLEVTFTPQEKGFLHAVVCFAKASTTVYVDPKITVT